MLNLVPVFIRRYLHLIVLSLFVCANLSTFGGISLPFCLAVADQSSDPSEEERESLETDSAIFPCHCSQRRNISRYVAPPEGRLQTLVAERTDCTLTFVLRPFTTPIASGAGLFQRC